MSWWLVDRQLFYSPVTDSRDFSGTEMLVGAGVCYFPSGHLGFGKTLVSHALVKWFVLGQASLCTKCSGIISESLYPPSTYWKQERAFLWPSLQSSGWASGGQTHRSVGVSLGPGPLVFLTLKWVRTEPRTIQLVFLSPGPIPVEFSALGLLLPCLCLSVPPVSVPGGAVIPDLTSAGCKKGCWFLVQLFHRYQGRSGDPCKLLTC